VDAVEDHRKKIIIHEINYWKSNRMLPEHYCDFLLNLYTEGSSSAPRSVQKKTITGPQRLSILLLALLSLSIFLFYFTELSLILQISLAVIFGAASLLTVGFLIARSHLKLIPLLAASLLFLVTCVQVAEILYPGNLILLYAVTFGNCLLWLAAGFRWKIISYKISGIAGLLILAITIFV
jgi:hypothetical protein